MANPFLSGVQVGSEIVRSGFSEYDKSRDFSERLKERREDVSAHRTAGDRAQANKNEEFSLDRDSLAETTRHNKATEEWERSAHPAGGRPAGGRGSANDPQLMALTRDADKALRAMDAEMAARGSASPETVKEYNLRRSAVHSREKALGYAVPESAPPAPAAAPQKTWLDVLKGYVSPDSDGGAGGGAEDWRKYDAAP